MSVIERFKASLPGTCGRDFLAKLYADRVRHR